MQSELDRLCVYCDATKPVTEFYRGKGKQCKACKNRRDAARLRTPEGKAKAKKQPCKLKKWADKTFQWLDVKPTDY